MVRLPKGEAAMNDYLLQYKRSAAKRKHVFELSRQEFIEIVYSNCHYCGSPPNRDHPGLSKSRKDKYNGHILVNGIDRKDPNIGYKKDNCVPACDICNFGKQRLNTNQFKEWIEKLYHRLFGVNHVDSTASFSTSRAGASRILGR